MKNKELKTIWKLAKIVWIWSFCFWIIETIIFLIIEGWHWKATNEIEIYCDKIVSNMWIFALNLTIYIFVFVFLNFIKKRKSNNLT